MIAIQSFKEIIDYLKSTKKITSMRDLSDQTGSSYTYLSQLKNQREPITEKFVSTLNERLDTAFKLQPNKDFKYEHDFINYDIPIHMKEVVVLKRDAFELFPEFTTGEMAVKMVGHEMYPYISQGDYLVIKKMCNIDFIRYGVPYYIVTKSDYFKLCFYVHASDDPDFFLLVPYNKEYTDLLLPKKEILEMYKILGLIQPI